MKSNLIDTIQPDILQIMTPTWGEPFLSHYRYKGLKGGRGSGKSHFFAELLVEKLLIEPNTRAVCIREIQRSLEKSAKQLIVDKIKKFKVDNYFSIFSNEIRSNHGSGYILFIGMQDHTADSIKSLEGFDVAWCEEAQTLTRKTIDILIPTIRKTGSELWFSWNPIRETDPVQQVFTNLPNSILKHITYLDNPFCPSTLVQEAQHLKLKDPSSYRHIWLGEYESLSEEVIFRGKYTTSYFPLPHPSKVPSCWEGPYLGGDFGFSADPTVLVECWVVQRALYITRAVGMVGLDIDKIVSYFSEKFPFIVSHTSRWDSSRPETISYIRRNGLPKATGCKKGPGSVQDGIAFIKSFDQVFVHPSCDGLLSELSSYRYRKDRFTGEVTSIPEDRNNHYIDALRYAIEPLIKSDKVSNLELYHLPSPSYTSSISATF